MFDRINDERIQAWHALGSSLLLYHALKINCHSLYSTIDNFNNHQAYHNKHHMFAVALRAHEILVNTICSSELRDKISKTLFLAASLHDLDHSGTTIHDSENIERTKSRLPAILDHETARAVYSIIECTQFPYVKDPQSLSEMCLRDADLLMVLEPDFPIFLKGLEKELSKSITMEENIQFLKKQKFFTAYGQKLFNDFLARYEQGKTDVSLKNLSAIFDGEGRLFNIIARGQSFIRLKFLRIIRNHTSDNHSTLIFQVDGNQLITIPLNDISSINEDIFVQKQIYRKNTGFEIEKNISNKDILEVLYPRAQPIGDS